MIYTCYTGMWRITSCRGKVTIEPLWAMRDVLAIWRWWLRQEASHRRLRAATHWRDREIMTDWRGRGAINSQWQKSALISDQRWWWVELYIGQLRLLHGYITITPCLWWIQMDIWTVLRIFQIRRAACWNSQGSLCVREKTHICHTTKKWVDWHKYMRNQ